MRAIRASASTCWPRLTKSSTTGPDTTGCTVWDALPSASNTPRPVARVGTEPKKAQTRPAMTSTVADSAITRMAGGMRLMR